MINQRPIFTPTQIELTTREIKVIPQFYTVSIDHVLRLGGGVYRAILDKIDFPKGFKYGTIDSRIHMLMKGMYPCIPGWHCDDFYRTERFFNQPDLESVMDKAPAVHFACVVDCGTGSFTSFLNSDVKLPAPRMVLANAIEQGRNLYSEYNDIIESQHKDSVVVIGNGEIARFSPLTFHKGNPAQANGWRMFFRLTFSNHIEPLNEVRTQTQVYLSDLTAGW